MLDNRRDHPEQNETDFVDQHGAPGRLGERTDRLIQPLTEAPSKARFFPPEARSVEETGLNLSFIADLVLKVMYTRGFLMGHEIADAVKLPFANIVDRALDYLRREHL